MDKKTAIAKLVRLYSEEQSLAEQIKEIKTEAKESGLEPAILSAVAKAIVTNKVDELKKKSDEILETINVARS
jgi:uncharacterized protein (UPF0335 family)